MQTTHLFRRHAAALVGALTLAFAASASAAGGEALDIELPSMATPVTAVQPRDAAMPVASVLQLQTAPITREQVRAELMAARADGTLSKFGDAGDTAEVLMARDAFNLAQGQAIMAAYRAEQARVLALQEAEMQRLALEAQARTMSSMSIMTDSRQQGEVRIDVIPMGTK